MSYVLETNALQQVLAFPLGLFISVFHLHASTFSHPAGMELSEDRDSVLTENCNSLLIAPSFRNTRIIFVKPCWLEQRKTATPRLGYMLSVPDDENSKIQRILSRCPVNYVRGCKRCLIKHKTYCRPDRNGKLVETPDTCDSGFRVLTCTMYLLVLSTK